ncbi:MAG: TraR/DksA C4-type zinc finger protein [Alicyclobacillaceae bacterium]|uniref:TraR/DksA C4-type zinc finger protein n=1 Tax=Alicyclobacillus sp. SP_1 TaxID=2942475 RepID=UPI002157428C|nr:TraR/DksA C4-type zinc finger protein [Alicyclobacillus sp. SP_1]MCY0886953.1 TraR/DksA C4-type zinc finger protein [Alicyclobacillaceae bacterium]MCY0897211.1 TraR/DksA C4-type zinc finger protein [Alicyclobacillaceae bacterium]
MPNTARTRLQKLRDEVAARWVPSGNSSLGLAMNEETSELSVYDNHPADVASEVLDREVRLGQWVADTDYLTEIDEALAAIDAGTYGVCRVCHVPLEPERLEAYPTALTCVRCKRAAEGARLLHHRPVEESVLHGNFAASNLDGKDATMFDGEDTWQALQRMNARPTAADPEDVGCEPWLEDERVDLLDGVTNEEWKSTLS